MIEEYTGMGIFLLAAIAFGFWLGWTMKRIDADNESTVLVNLAQETVKGAKAKNYASEVLYGRRSALMQVPEDVRLQADLKDAIDNEDYEEAAAIRDRINKLSSSKTQQLS